MKRFISFLFVLACLALAVCALAADPATPVAAAVPQASGIAAGMSWVTGNWINLVAAFGGLVTAFSLIAKITPTPKDDEWAAKLVRVIDWLALNTSRKQ